MFQKKAVMKIVKIFCATGVIRRCKYRMCNLSAHKELEDAQATNADLLRQNLTGFHSGNKYERLQGTNLSIGEQFLNEVQAKPLLKQY